MFRKQYAVLMDRFTPTDNLIRRTVDAAARVGREEGVSDQIRKNRRRKLIPAVAAVLAVVITIGAVVLSPSNSPLGFSIVANAAAGTDTLSRSEFTPISDIGAANAESGFIGLDLSNLYASYDPLILAEEPTMIGVSMFCMRVEGEDISKVTFTVNNGKFEVDGYSSYKVIDYENKTASYLGIEQEYSAFYDSITMPYDSQPEPISGAGALYSDVLLYVPCKYDRARDRERLERFLNLSAVKSGDPGKLESQEEFCRIYEDFMNELYRNTKIGITVTYKDGHTDAVNLSLRAVCTIVGTTVRRFRIAPGDSTASFKTCEVYDYKVSLNAKIDD